MIIKNGWLVNESEVKKADLRVLGSQIAEIAEHLDAQNEEDVLDAEGRYILPGGIDVHTHFDMPAGECMTSDNFISGTRAAICGGTTSVVDFAEYDEGKKMQDGLDTWHKKADGRSYCDYRFHMTVSEWDATTKDQILSMKEQGIASFKAYTAYKSGLGVDDKELFRILQAMKEAGTLLCVHCENGDVLECLQEELRAKDPARIANHPESRPNLVEKEAVSRVLDLAFVADAPVYLVHISTKEAVEVIRLAKMRGQKVYAETCPQYLLLDDSKYDLPGFESAKYVLSPPLRKKEDQEALWEGLKDGTIDTVSTDHCSFWYDGQKSLGKEDFTRIPNGIPGAEQRMELFLHHASERGFTLPEIVRKTSYNQAGIFGLAGKGRLEEGCDADLVIVDGKHPHVIRAKTQKQEVDYTPYEGMEVSWKVQDVFRRGEVMVRNGEFLAEAQDGIFLG